MTPATWGRSPESPGCSGACPAASNPTGCVVQTAAVPAREAPSGLASRRYAWLRTTAWHLALAAALALDVLEAVLTGRPEGPASRLHEAVGRRTKEAEEAYWRSWAPGEGE